MGTHFDLPIAVGIMEGNKIINIKKDILENYLFMGEISLTGEIKRTQGIVNGAILAKEKGYKGIVIPYENLKEGSLIKRIEIIPVKNLKDTAKFLETGEYEKYKLPEEDESNKVEIDFYDVKG